MSTIFITGPDLPRITCPDDITTPTLGGTNVAVISLLDEISVTHPVEDPEDIYIESNAPSGNEYIIGVTEVTFTATDTSGNTDSCTVTVTVEGMKDWHIIFYDIVLQ